MTLITNLAPDPDEDYITEEEDFDLEDDNDLREIEVGDDIGEPDPEDDSLMEEDAYEEEDD